MWPCSGWEAKAAALTRSSSASSLRPVAAYDDVVGHRHLAHGLRGRPPHHPQLTHLLEAVAGGQPSAAGWPACDHARACVRSVELGERLLEQPGPGPVPARGGRTTSDSVVLDHEGEPVGLHPRRERRRPRCRSASQVASSRGEVPSPPSASAAMSAICPQSVGVHAVEPRSTRSHACPRPWGGHHGASPSGRRRSGARRLAARPTAAGAPSCFALSLLGSTNR